MSNSDDDNLLSRWSRRKQATRDAATQEQTLPEQSPDAPGNAHRPAEDAEASAAREAELQANRVAAEAVDLETLDKDSDFSVFMKDGVPDVLRRRAMAMLWRSNPLFANVDGLVDYDDDFGSPNLVMKTLKSAWQVGRGYAKDEDADKPETIAEAAETEGEEAGDVSEAEDHDDEAASAEAKSGETDDPDALPSDSGDAPIAFTNEQMPDQDVEHEQDAEPVPRVSLRRRLMLDPET